MMLLGTVASHGAGARSGDFQLISTTILTGTQATVSFTSIPSSYKHLQLRLTARGASGGAIYLQYNSNTGTNYSSHNLHGNGSTAASQAITSTDAPLILRNGGIATTANIFSGAIIDILDYASTSKAKTLRSFGGAYDNGVVKLIELGSSLWYSTPAAITSIDIKHNGSGFTQYSRFSLYGLAG